MFYSVFGNIDYEAVKKRDEFGVGEYAPIDFDSILLLQNDITLLSFRWGTKFVLFAQKMIQIK